MSEIFVDNNNNNVINDNSINNNNDVNNKTNRTNESNAAVVERVVRPLEASRNITASQAILVSAIANSYRYAHQLCMYTCTVVCLLFGSLSSFSIASLLNQFVYRLISALQKKKFFSFLALLLSKHR